MRLPRLFLFFMPLCDLAVCMSIKAASKKLNQIGYIYFSKSKHGSSVCFLKSRHVIVFNLTDEILSGPV